MELEGEITVFFPLSAYNHIKVNTTLDTKVTIVMITAFLLYVDVDRSFGPDVPSEYKALGLCLSI